MGGSGGGKTSQSQTSTTSPYAGLLASFGKSALPVYKTLNSQILQALQTGGVNAQIPMINRSVDAARQAASTSMESTKEALARSGLGQTGFAQSLLAELGQQSGQDIAQIPTSAAAQLIGMAPGQTSQGISAAGQAGQLTRNISQQYTPSFWDFFTQGMQSGGSFGAPFGQAAGTAPVTP